MRTKRSACPMLNWGFALVQCADQIDEHSRQLEEECETDQSDAPPPRGDACPALINFSKQSVKLIVARMSDRTQS